MPDYTVKQFCRQVCLSERAVRQHIRDGRIPHYRIGATIRIPAEAVDALRDGALTTPRAAAEPSIAESLTLTVTDALAVIEDIADAGGSA